MTKKQHSAQPLTVEQLCRANEAAREAAEKLPSLLAKKGDVAPRPQNAVTFTARAQVNVLSGVSHAGLLHKSTVPMRVQWKATGEDRFLRQEDLIGLADDKFSAKAMKLFEQATRKNAKLARKAKKEGVYVFVSSIRVLRSDPVVIQAQRSVDAALLSAGHDIGELSPEGLADLLYVVSMGLHQAYELLENIGCLDAIDFTQKHKKTAKLAKLVAQQFVP